tara:strand:+ start:224 stop:475 length:252 start_codon:yes stop_codon:yes gene_type:complete
MDSGNPEIEFINNLGSKTKIHAPINAILVLKNRLDNKKIGIIVAAEKIIDVNLCIIWKSMNVSGFVMLKITDKNTGQPLFGKL